LIALPDTGADFHSAVVATAPGEKLLAGRRPVRNWTQTPFGELTALPPDSMTVLRGGATSTGKGEDGRGDERKRRGQ